MQNIPQVRLGIVAVSRGCFIAEDSRRRMQNVAQALGDMGTEAYVCPVIVEDEDGARAAVEDVKKAGVNALCVFLGNFGPETPETLIAKHFAGPVMYAAAAEGDGDLMDGRGDAFCGMLNCSYNLGLRNLSAYIPAYPVGNAAEVAEMAAGFVPIARALLGVSQLKIITFGPRPNDFLACNAPLKPLFDLGVEIEENSELDLLAAYRQHDGDARIEAKVAEMQRELGRENGMWGVLPRLAQYELTLLDWYEAHKGYAAYAVFANKCWPEFEAAFGFVPCYVNSRLAGMGIPVACEADIYGALSEYIGQCVAGESVTLLDINNTGPPLLCSQLHIPYKNSDLFMGFHCGNTPVCRMKQPELGHQRIMKRQLEPDGAPDITRGTIEGDLEHGPVTIFRLQGSAEGKLQAYAAQGEILDVPTRSFGSIGIFAIPQMARFYRYALIEKHFPHHTAVAFGNYGQEIFDVLKLLGVTDINYNQPPESLYPGENPFGGRA